MTAPQLFAGICSGQHECYYCGGPCSGDYTTGDYVKSTFTNRDIVARPASPYVCASCVESMSSNIGENIRKLRSRQERGKLCTPAENGHSFRLKADSDSGAIRTAIPAESGRFFRSSGIRVA